MALSTNRLAAVAVDEFERHPTREDADVEAEQFLTGHVTAFGVYQVTDHHDFCTERFESAVR
ncbi:hypothetical protein ACF082_34270 [Streptomyces lydicus]|uniref:hypothetical protein n=1 Tax=Streptomyces lydicus TaxID=47763 RepID=UPI003701A1CB